MRTTRHVFNDNREAQAFVCGVLWAGDHDEIEVIDTLSGFDEDGVFIATVIVNDDLEDDANMVIEITEDHREHV